MTIRLFYVQILALLFYSCSNSTNQEQPADTELTVEQQQVEELQKQVIAIHDEVMPLMGDLMSLKGQLEEKNVALEASAQEDAPDQLILNQMVITNLELAHEGMMSWMRNYEQVDIQGDPAANTQYLEEEKAKINEIKEQVSKALKSAEEALGSKI